MSEFFDNDDENEQISVEKISLVKEDEESDDKTTNFSKKTSQLRKDIFELEDDLQNSKRLDVFVRDLPKKYKILLKRGCPSYLAVFCRLVVDSAKSSAVKFKFRKFLEKYPEEVVDQVCVENLVVDPEEVDVDDKFERDLVKIISKESLRQVDELLSLAKRVDNNSHLLRVYMQVLDLRYREKGWQVFEHVSELLLMVGQLFTDFSSNEFLFKGVSLKNIFKLSLPLYVDFLVGCVESKDFQRFERVLDVFRPLDESYIDRISIFYRFYRKHEVFDTSDVVFRLTSMMRRPGVLYGDVKDIYMDDMSKYAACDKFSVFVKIEFGMFAYSNFDYECSFRVLQECYFSELISGVELERVMNILLVLVIILDSTVVNEPFYEVFIVNMISLETNILFLASCVDVRSEIYRAFYLLENFYDEESFLVLKRVAGVNDDIRQIFKDKVETRQREILASVA